jgi:hypothetical protein
MTNEPPDWPTPAETEFTGKLVEIFQRDLESEFPGRGRTVFVHTVLLAASELFHRLEDEDDLADIMNAGFQARSSPWRLVRVT